MSYLREFKRGFIKMSVFGVLGMTALIVGVNWTRSDQRTQTPPQYKSRYYSAPKPVALEEPEEGVPMSGDPAINASIQKTRQEAVELKAQTAKAAKRKADDALELKAQSTKAAERKAEIAERVQRMIEENDAAVRADDRFAKEQEIKEKQREEAKRLRLIQEQNAGATSSTSEVQTGPRGGHFITNGNGNKDYHKKK